MVDHERAVELAMALPEGEVGTGHGNRIPHFDGDAAVLVQLDTVDEAVLHDLLVDAWLAVAPRRLAETFLADTDR